jgi:uncharacterized membrane protein (UPF0136 family)
MHMIAGTFALPAADASASSPNAPGAITSLLWIYLFVFGLVTIAGGVLGFVKAKSRASLIAGSISGALLLLSGWLVSSGSRSGIVLGLVVSAALLGRFGMAFRKTKKLMPAGLISLLSIVGIALTIAALLGR